MKLVSWNALCMYILLVKNGASGHGMLCLCTCKMFHISCTNWSHTVIHLYMYIHVIIPLTQDGGTPLYIASQNGHSDVVNILTRNGADVNLACDVWS